MDQDQLEAAPPEHAPVASLALDDQPQASRGNKVLVFAVLLVAAAVAWSGWSLSRSHAVSFTTPYQAVLLVNGQVYFGHLEGYGASNPVLREVYYVQSVMDPESKKQSNILLKRGKEWHAPDRMYINPQQIVTVEPVGPDSRVAELIKSLKTQR